MARGIDVFSTLLNIPKIWWRYTVAPKAQRAFIREEFNLTVRREFAKHLANSMGDVLRRKGIPEDQITLMREKGLGPEGYQIHHKIPIHAGGTNHFSNLAMSPVGLHHAIHYDVDKQILGMKEGQSKLVSMHYVQGLICDTEPWLDPAWCPDAPAPVPPPQSYIVWS